MIFIKHENGKINYIHHMPFDEVNGLGKTQEELEKEGIFVDNIPSPEEKEGKIYELFVNPETNELYYEYTDAPETEEDVLRAKIANLERSQTEQDELIMTLMFGGGMFNE